MLVIDKKLVIFDIKEVYFADYPFDDVCDRITFHFCKNKTDVKGFSCQKMITSIIDLNQDLDTIWQKIDRKSTRYGIRHASNLGVNIKINEEYEEFYQIYKSFIQKKGINLYGTTVSLELMKKYGTLFVSKYNGEVLGGHLYLEDDTNLMLWISASKRLEVDKEKARLIGNANRLLHWKAIQYAKEKQLKEFDFGGLWPTEEANKDKVKYAINSFKLDFGGYIADRYIYDKVHSRAYKAMRYIYNNVNGHYLL